jgi:hypothetical protein
LRYSPNPEGDCADAGDDRGKQVKTQSKEGTSKGKAMIAVAQKREIDVKGTRGKRWGRRLLGFLLRN